MFNLENLISTLPYILISIFQVILILRGNLKDASKLESKKAKELEKLTRKREKLVEKLSTVATEIEEKKE